jgi:hypothetical protein
MNLEVIRKELGLPSPEEFQRNYGRMSWEQKRVCYWWEATPHRYVVRVLEKLGYKAEVFPRGP